jgi:hypothetical protein
MIPQINLLFLFNISPIFVLQTGRRRAGGGRPYAAGLVIMRQFTKSQNEQKVSICPFLYTGFGAALDILTRKTALIGG